MDVKTNTGVAVIPAAKDFFNATVIGKNGQDLVSILKDSIEKVKADPAFIPQAVAIKENINAIIDLAKVEAATLVAINNLNSK